MPRISRQVSHELGKEELIRRLNHATGRAKSMSVFTEQWTGDRMTFFASVQGVKLSGTIEAGASVLKVDINLPLIAMPFSGWLDGMIKSLLNTPVAESVREQPAGREDSRVTPAWENDDAAPVTLFLHIPKAAGTTLGEFVFDNCRLPGEASAGLPADALFKKGVYFSPFGFFKDPADLHPESLRPALSHPALRAVIGHFSFGIHALIPRPATYITLLRHPLDRIVSLYAFLQARDPISMEAFLEMEFNELDNDQTRRLSGVEAGFGLCDRSHLERAKENIDRCFSVAGTTERFDETLLLLKRRMDWKGTYIPAPKNVTPGRPKTGSLPAGIRDRILEMNRLDLELHAYVSGLLDRAIEVERAGIREELESLHSLRQNDPA